MTGSITLFISIKEVLGEVKAQQLIESFETHINERIEEKSKEVSIKLGEPANKGDIQVAVSALELKIEQVRSDLLKWIIGLYMAGFLTLVGMILGLYFKK